MRRAALALAAALLLGAAALLARPGRSPQYDFKPVERPSALEGWTAPWPESPQAPRSTAAPPRKWIVMGWDGASWDVILPLVAAGRLPHLAGLMREGSYGRLLTARPTQSAVLWTSIATGVRPPRHGVLGFAKPDSGPWASLRALFGAKERRTELFSNADRRSKALWNLASENSLARTSMHAKTTLSPL